MKKVRVGLLGFGNVGSGTYDTLKMNMGKIERETGVTFSIDKILVRDPSRPRRSEAPAELFTKDPDDIIGNPDIDIVCELLGGIEPASQYMLNAMKFRQHGFRSGFHIFLYKRIVYPAVLFQYDIQIMLVVLYISVAVFYIYLIRTQKVHQHPVVRRLVDHLMEVEVDVQHLGDIFFHRIELHALCP